MNWMYLTMESSLFADFVARLKLIPTNLYPNKSANFDNPQTLVPKKKIDS